MSNYVTLLGAEDVRRAGGQIEYAEKHGKPVHYLEPRAARIAQKEGE